MGGQMMEFLYLTNTVSFLSIGFEKADFEAGCIRSFQFELKLSEKKQIYNHKNLFLQEIKKKRSSMLKQSSKKKLHELCRQYVFEGRWVELLKTYDAKFSLKFLSLTAVKSDSCQIRQLSANACRIYEYLPESAMIFQSDFLYYFFSTVRFLICAYKRIFFNRVQPKRSVYMRI